MPLQVTTVPLQMGMQNVSSSFKNSLKIMFLLKHNVTCFFNFYSLVWTVKYVCERGEATLCLTFL